MELWFRLCRVARTMRVETVDLDLVVLRILRRNGNYDDDDVIGKQCIHGMTSKVKERRHTKLLIYTSSWPVRSFFKAR